MEIYILRHGKTAWNEVRLLQGSTDIPLNESGIEVALLTRDGMKDIKFDRIYSSPLKRAYETAEIIRGDRDIPIITDVRLRELSFGNLEGQNRFKLEQDKMGSFQYFFSEPEKYVAPKDGESFEDICNRTSTFLKEVVEPQQDKFKRILIVGHGAMNKSLICNMFGHGIENYWAGGLQKNCGVMIVSLNNGKYELIDWNKVFYK